mgnify:CR=1 FL=1
MLTGGGARAAYQVGVVKAVRDILGNPVKNPFPILCGTSAGAINAATLAVYADDFSRARGQSARSLGEHALPAHLPHRPGHIMRSGARWLAGDDAAVAPQPDVAARQRAADARCWSARSTSSASRTTSTRARCTRSASPPRATPPGRACRSSRAAAGLEGWERNQRIGAAVPLKLDCLLASVGAAVHLPAVKFNREYFGDGSVRQIAPVSPALHLGADRVLVVGTGRQTGRRGARALQRLPVARADRRPRAEQHLPRQPVGGHRAPGAHQPHRCS